MSRTQRALQGGAITVVQLGVQLLLQFVVAPVVLRYAGQDALGAFAAIVQVLGYMIAIDVGFYSVLIKYLAAAHGRDGVGLEFVRVMATARVFLASTNLVYGGVIAVLAFYAGPWLNLPLPEAADAQLGLLFLAGWTVLRIPLLVSSFALVSVQDLAARNGIGVLSSVGRFGVSLLLVALGFGLTGLMVGYIASDVVEQVGCRWRFGRLHPSARTFHPAADRGLLLEMLKLSTGTLLIMLGSRILFFSDNVIVGLLTSAAAGSVYYTTQLPGTFGWMTINRMADNASPGINDIYSRAAAEQLRAVYLRLHRYILMLSVPFAAAVLLFNERIVSLWVGPAQFGGQLLNLGLAGVSLVVTLGWADYAFLLAGGKIQSYALAYFGAGVLKVGLSVLCCQLWGPAGVMIATVPAALGYVVYGQWLVRSRLNVSLPHFLRASVAPVVFPAFGTTAVLGVVGWCWPATSWLGLFAQGALFIVIYGAATWYALPEVERTTIRAKFLGAFRSAMFPR